MHTLCGIRGQTLSTDYFAVSTSDTTPHNRPIYHLVNSPMKLPCVSHVSTLSPGVFHSSEGLTVPQMAYSTPVEYRRLPVNQV